MNRFKDWLNQAEKDLQAAKISEENQHYEWACFQAQQSAEKALKALLLYLNIESWGHSLLHLLQEWKKTIEQMNNISLDEVEFENLKEGFQSGYILYNKIPEEQLENWI